MRTTLPTQIPTFAALQANAGTDRKLVRRARITATATQANADQRNAKSINTVPVAGR
jgi:hypothetical protein